MTTQESGKSSHPLNVIVATDCGSTTTKAILIERIGDEYRQTYRGEAPTTVEAPFEDVTRGVLNAIAEIDRLVLHGVDDHSAIEALLRELGLRSDIAVVPPTPQMTADEIARTAVFITADSDRKHYRRNGHPPNLVVSEGEPDLLARIASFELAYRMQMEATDAFDIAKETGVTPVVYGLQEGYRNAAAVRAAGGVPFEFPIHPIQETCKRPTAALDRNLQYLSLVEILYGYPIDGVVLTTGCDKTTPAQLMAAASADLPAIQVNGGPRSVGRWRGKPVGSPSGCTAERRRSMKSALNRCRRLSRIVSE